MAFAATEAGSACACPWHNGNRPLAGEPSLLQGLLAAAGVMFPGSNHAKTHLRTFES
jgi:hypothetical protein